MYAGRLFHGFDALHLIYNLFIYLFVCFLDYLFSHIILQGEGVAYRGRLLVELESKLGEEIDKELEVMKGPELIRVQVVQPFTPY